MNTIDKFGDIRSMEPRDQAIAMAVAVLLDRMMTLPADDRKDLFELVRGVDLTNREEVSELQVSMLEILDAKPLTLREWNITQGVPVDSGSSRWLLSLGECIRKARLKADLTQEQVAEKTGLPQSHISRIENGKHHPSHKTMCKIAAAMGVRPEDIDPGCA